MKQIIPLHLNNLITLGCKLLMYDAAYRKKPAPTDKDVEQFIKSIITKPTTKKRKAKIKPFAELNEQERIALFTKNRELIRNVDIHNTADVEIQDVASDYDISKPECLRNFAYDCFFIALLYSTYCAGYDDCEELMDILDLVDYTISQKACEAMGYWTIKLNKTISYVNSQGKSSFEAGQCTMNAAKVALKKYGGIEGYYNLRRGEKKKAREEIEQAIIQLKSEADRNDEFIDVERNVYNILKKIKHL